MSRLRYCNKAKAQNSDVRAQLKGNGKLKLGQCKTITDEIREREKEESAAI